MTGSRPTTGTPGSSPTSSGPARSLASTHPPKTRKPSATSAAAGRTPSRTSSASVTGSASSCSAEGSPSATAGTWSQQHRYWLHGLAFDRPADQVVFEDYVLAVEQQEARLAALDEQLAAVAEAEPYSTPVAHLRCFRGIDTVTALSLVAELHDVRRFTSAPQLMAYLGLVPSEHTSGGHRRQGAITRAGNTHVRRLLIETARHYRHQPAVGVNLARRRRGQPPAVIARADRAQQRLSRQYRRMAAKGKHDNTIVVAVARMLVGYLWETPRTAQTVEA